MLPPFLANFPLLYIETTVGSVEIMWLAPGGGTCGNTGFCAEPAVQRDSPTHLPGSEFVSHEDQRKCEAAKAAPAAQLRLADGEVRLSPDAEWVPA